MIKENYSFIFQSERERQEFEQYLAASGLFHQKLTEQNIEKLTGVKVLNGEMKKCRTCKEIKSVSSFRKDASMHDGHRATCKLCQKKAESTKATEKLWKEMAAESNMSVDDFISMTEKNIDSHPLIQAVEKKLAISRSKKTEKK